MAVPPPGEVKGACLGNPPALLLANALGYHRLPSQYDPVRSFSSEAAMTHQSPQFTFTLPPAPLDKPRPRGRAVPALWLIGLGLLANAAVMLFAKGQTSDLVLDRTALAQAAPQPGQLLGARGIYMMPAQLGVNSWGLYLMDVDSQTICVYKATPESSHFRLMASRSFKYDRFLEDLNNETLRPKEVQKIVEAQQQRKDLLQKDELPTVDQNPRPDENQPYLPKPESPKP